MEIPLLAIAAVLAAVLVVPRLRRRRRAAAAHQRRLENAAFLERNREGLERSGMVFTLDDDGHIRGGRR